MGRQPEAELQTNPRHKKATQSRAGPVRAFTVVHSEEGYEVGESAGRDRERVAETVNGTDVPEIAEDLEIPRDEEEPESGFDIAVFLAQVR